jgi:multiple sugar transport system ATP-binding protein
MRTELKAIHQRLRTTSIYVTHDQIEAMTMADKIVVMNAGKVEQIGTPLGLYDSPANLFVAGFIGSPAMNFMTGTVRRNGSGMVVNLGAGLDLPTRNSSAREGQAVTVGVRPEHFTVSDTGVRAEVRVVEPTGADTQVACTIGGADVVAIFRERHEFKPGASIGLYPELTYLFDPASGARL